MTYKEEITKIFNEYEPICTCDACELIRTKLSYIKRDILGVFP